MATIDQFKLTNNGGFVARIYCEYRDSSSNKWVQVKCTGDITLGCSKTVELGACGVPNGATVRLMAFVVSGADKTGAEEFTFQKGCNAIAQYKISGTTLINKLKYLGIFQPSNDNMAVTAAIADTLDEEEIPVMSIPRELTEEEWAGLEAAYKNGTYSQNGSNEPLN